MGTTSSAGPGLMGDMAARSADRPCVAADSARATRMVVRVTRCSICSMAMPSGPESCSSFPPLVCQATSPEMTSMGMRDRCAEVTPVTTLVAPGPAVTSTQATWPLAR
jgi:hypothetical protein